MKDREVGELKTFRLLLFLFGGLKNSSYLCGVRGKQKNLARQTELKYN